MSSEPFQHMSCHSLTPSSAGIRRPTTQLQRICSEVVHGDGDRPADVALKPGLERLEAANPWLLACGCQRQAIAALLTDLVAALPRVQTTTATARSLLEFFDANPPARESLARAMIAQLQRILSLRLPPGVLDKPRPLPPPRGAS